MRYPTILLIFLVLALASLAHADTFTINLKSQPNMSWCTNIMAGGEDDTLLVYVTYPLRLELFSPYLLIQKIGTLTGTSYLSFRWRPHCEPATSVTVPVYGTATSDSGSTSVALQGIAGSAYHYCSFRDNTGTSKDSLSFVESGTYPQEYYPFVLPAEVMSVGGDMAPPISGLWEVVITHTGNAGNKLRVITGFRNEKK